MNGKEYGHGILTNDWKEMYLNDVNNQNNIAKEVIRRLFMIMCACCKLVKNIDPLQIFEFDSNPDKNGR